MATVGTHYDELLADIYAWMLGDFDARVETQLAWLRGIVGNGSGRALDLGAGAGVDTIALARLGYEVVSVDASAKLVAETRARAGKAGLAHRVETVEADLVAFLDEERNEAGTAICLGDTLTHLASPAAVQRMFRLVRRRIAANGTFVLGYRDLSAELRDLDRFFLVRSDPSRIMTCFVEYLPEHAMVHDIVHTRTESGWQMAKSCYPKLRLAVDEVSRWLVEAGFAHVERVACAGGMIGLVARHAA